MRTSNFIHLDYCIKCLWMTIHRLTTSMTNLQITTFHTILLYIYRLFYLIDSSSLSMNLIDKLNGLFVNMIRHQRLSSSLRCKIASRIRLVSFFPLCSPCLTFIFVITFFHPAYTFSLASSSLFMAYLRRFYWARSDFYLSFF